MQSYKSIEVFSKVNLSTELEESNFKDLPTFLINGYCSFGKIKINENFISTILQSRPINLVIHEECVDSFLCVFIKNRIVLTEKIRCQNKFINLINKKYWPKTILKNLNYFNNLMGCYYAFQCIECDYVSMNNSAEIIIPLFENG